MGKIIKSMELKLGVENWGGDPIFTAQVDGNQVASAYSLSGLIDSVDADKDTIFSYENMMDKSEEE